MMRRENESIQNNPVVQKVLDTLKMFCVVLGLRSPERKRGCVCVLFFVVETKTKTKFLCPRIELQAESRKGNIRVLLSIP